MFSKILALTVFAAAASVNAQTPPYSGQVSLMTFGLCLTAEGTNNGGLVDLQTCERQNNQAWTFTNGAVTIFNGTKCLDVKDGNEADGASLQVWDCTEGDVNQQWYYTDDLRLAWTDHGKCLDRQDGNTFPGTHAQLWTCTDNDTYQIWYSEPF